MPEPEFIEPPIEPPVLAEFRAAAEKKKESRTRSSHSSMTSIRSMLSQTGRASIISQDSFRKKTPNA